MAKSKLTRRDFVVLSTMASAGTVLAACARATPAPEEVVEEPSVEEPAEEVLEATPVPEVKHLVTWSIGAGPQEFQEQLIAEYNEAHPGVEIEYDPALAGLEWLTEGMQKLRVALENKAGPDFIGGIDAGSALEAVVSSGEVLDLSEAYDQFGWQDEIPKVFIERVTVEGKIYAVPINVETVGLFYNMDLFEELDLTVPETFDEYLQVLDDIKEAGFYGYAIGLAGGWPSAFMASAFCYGSAGSEYKAVLSGNMPWTECDRCLDGLEAYYGIVEAGYTNPEVLGIDQTQANDLFFQGQTAMTLSGPWTINAIKDAEPDFEVGFFYMPPVDSDTDIRTFGGEGGTMIASKHSEHPEAVLAFMDWFFSPETAAKVLRGAASIMPIPFTVPDDIDPLLAQVTEETLKNIHSVGFWPVTHLAPDVFRQMNQFIQGMMGEELTPAQVLEEMQIAHETYEREKAEED